MPECAPARDAETWLAGLRRCCPTRTQTALAQWAGTVANLDERDRAEEASRYGHAWLEHHAHAFDGHPHALRERLQLLTLPLRWGWRLREHGGWHDAWQRWGVVTHRFQGVHRVSEDLWAQMDALVLAWQRWRLPAWQSTEGRWEHYLDHLRQGDVAWCHRMRLRVAVDPGSPETWRQAWAEGLGRMWGDEGWAGSGMAGAFQHELRWWGHHDPVAADSLTGGLPGMHQAKAWLVREALSPLVASGETTRTRGRI